eukprot:scaffold19949_cov74-Skeletonema_menzelii.AAC.1
MLEFRNIVDDPLVNIDARRWDPRPSFADVCSQRGVLLACSLQTRYRQRSQLYCQHEYRVQRIGRVRSKKGAKGAT